MSNTACGVLNPEDAKGDIKTLEEKVSLKFYVVFVVKEVALIGIHGTS